MKIVQCVSAAMAVVLLAGAAYGADLGGLKAWASAEEGYGFRSLPMAFDGYRNYWAKDAWAWYSGKGLYLASRQEPQAGAIAVETEIGSQMLLEELWIQYGFVKALAACDHTELAEPSEEAFGKTIGEGPVLVSVLDHGALGRALVGRLPEAYQFRRNRAFMLEGDRGPVFVLACPTQDELDRLRGYVLGALEVVKRYDFHRGIPGVRTNYLTITTGPNHNPYKLVGLARKLGCDWMTVCGYNDWMLATPAAQKLRGIGDGFVFVSGQYVTGGVIYGLERYPDVQDNTVEAALDWAHARGGYFFANLSTAGDAQAARYHGYLLGGAGDQGRVDELGVPYLAQAGEIGREAPPTMVALLEKGTPLTQATLFDAILARRAVTVYAEGLPVGPAPLRDAFYVLTLERAVLEERFGGPLELEAEVEQGVLSVTLRNRSEEPMRAEVTFSLTEGMALAEGVGPRDVALAPLEQRTIREPLLFGPEASGQNNLASVKAETEAGVAHALAHVELPPVVSTHGLMLEQPGRFVFPVSIWNSGENARVETTVTVRRAEENGEVFKEARDVTAKPWQETREDFALTLDSGDYVVETTALGVTRHSTLAVKPGTGTVSTREEDLDGDGLPEIIMEDGQVRATVLLLGGRVIEYVVKSQGDNLLFKLWPDTPPMHGKVGGVRQFYPYGGLEEFIGYPYIGGHVAYHYAIEEANGGRARVKVWANIHGSRITKEYTLYAGSGMLEARYKFEDMTPTINVIGINPLFQIGPSTGPEDRYYFPEETLVETRPELERYYGRAVFPREGWAAGYDTEQDLSLMVGFPVADPIYLHLWNNHPDNMPTPYYYTEIQPWLELRQGTTTYFSYYVMGAQGPWEKLSERFRGMGLVTVTEKAFPWAG